jgi:hypothetical protein
MADEDGPADVGPALRRLGEYVSCVEAMLLDAEADLRAALSGTRPEPAPPPRRESAPRPRRAPRARLRARH